jgi:hypothetical protein
MDEPLPVPEGDEANFIDVLFPPENLKPKGDFKRLLSEYQLWIRQNQDRGYAAFLIATQKTALSEDTPWEIRQMMRQMREDAPASQENNALKWHLILHLAREFETNIIEADKMLKRVKQKKSPLEDAIGEGTQLQNFVGDLAQYETDLFKRDYHLRQIVEAWLGLFGEIIPDRGLLITLDQYIMNYVAEIFKDKAVPLSKEKAEEVLPKLASRQSDFTATHLPHFTNNVNTHTDHVLMGLSGKTIVFLEN